MGCDLGHDLDLRFSRSNMWDLLYLCQNGPIGTKRKANKSIELQASNVTIKIWPRPWPWPWIIKVKCGICYISNKRGPIATKRKANISIELQPSNVTIGFDLGHDIDLEICYISAKNGVIATKRIANISTDLNFSKFDHQIWPWPWYWPWTFKVKYRISYISLKMVRLARDENQAHRLNSRPQMWPSNLTLAMALTLNFQDQI